MSKKKNKMSFSFCLSMGMLFGVALGIIIDKLAVGIALGNLFGVMYYNIFSSSDDNSEEKDPDDDHPADL